VNKLVKTWLHKSASDWRKILYNIVLVILLPVVALYLLWRLVVQGKSRAGLAQRLGILPGSVSKLKEADGHIIWVHAVSVGEVAAAEPILQQLRLAEPTGQIVLSTTTPTGRKMAEKLDIDVEALIYFPFDFPGITERVLRTIAPDLIILMEAELWPNLLAAAGARNIPTAVLNGRISDTAFPKNRLFRPLFAWTLSNVDLVCAQSQKDADRFIALGAAAQRVKASGNSKFDENFPHIPPEEQAKWRQDLGLSQEAPVLLAGSTHPGEDEQILNAFDQLHSSHPNLELIIAPRHPERGDEVEKLVSEHGYATYRRSRVLAELDEGKDIDLSSTTQVRVVILDTIGELNHIFSVATLVFMGGSLVPRGGHNILQPLAQGKPVIFGPHMHNFQDITDLALDQQAAIQVENGSELVEVTDRLLSSQSEREFYQTKGRSLLQKQSGASQRMVSELALLLAER